MWKYICKNKILSILLFNYSAQHMHKKIEDYSVILKIDIFSL